MKNTLPIIRSILFSAGVLMLAGGLRAQPFAGSDDFNSGSSSLWGYDFRLTGTTGLLDFTNSRLDLTKDTGDADNDGWRRPVLHRIHADNLAHPAAPFTRRRLLLYRFRRWGRRLLLR